MINGIEHGPEFLNPAITDPEALVMIGEVDASVAVVGSILNQLDMDALRTMHVQTNEDF